MEIRLADLLEGMRGGLLIAQVEARKKRIVAPQSGVVRFGQFSRRLAVEAPVAG
jgi:hypothetical protein